MSDLNSSRNGKTADAFQSSNWRIRKDGANRKIDSDIDISSEKPHLKEFNSTDYSANRYQVYRGRDRNSNRGAYNSQRTNNSRGFRDPQHAGRGGSSERINITRDRRNVLWFDSGLLENLSQMDTDVLLSTLIKQKMGFEYFLNSSITSNTLVLTLRVLVNLCRNDDTEKVTGLLIHACSNKFLKNLESFMTTLCFEEESNTVKQNKLYWDDRSGFWNNLIEIFEKMIELLPSKARDELIPILSKIDRIVTTIENNQDYAINKKVRESAGIMLEKLQEQLKKFETKTVNSATNSHRSEADPPEDFRWLSVIPTKENLFDNDPFIRANKISEAYDSVDHYLDVQFRLLREDFFSPLRQGLLEYLDDPNQRRNSNLRIYRKVRFMAKQISQHQSGYTISFGIKKHINWRDSKRLMFGELLCLSKDNFNTILFATVSNSDESFLREGLLVIKLCRGTHFTEEFFKHDFVMLESKLYFEPYFVVLKTMQSMYERTFPMKNYLIDADTAIALPRYLKEKEIEGEITLRYKSCRLPIVPDKPWPSPEKLGFDERQYQAFKCALTEELAVIQGPPGTGKTFLALQIIRTMLETKRYWREHGPIIVVCLTNHALDQFLEGILCYTRSIVRIGSRSKNENLHKFALKERLLASRLKPEYRLETNFDDGYDIEFNSEFNDLYGYHERDYCKWKRHKRRGCFLPPTLSQKNMFDERLQLSEILDEIEACYYLIHNLTQKNAIVPIEMLMKWNKEFYGPEEFRNWLLQAVFGVETTDGMKEPWKHKLLNQFLKEEEGNKYSFNYQWEVLLPLHCIDELINDTEEQIRLYRQNTDTHELPFDLSNEWEHDISELLIFRSSLEQNLAQHPLINKGNVNLCQDPLWEAYWGLIILNYEHVMHKLAGCQQVSNYLAQDLAAAKELVDREELEKYDVIGLTTTAAARLHNSLEFLHAPIVLVEEAAEILEAQVVCSLTKSCQHLILIGDHKQLRPKPAVYELGTKYNLNISLFERMVNIRGNHTQLMNQHRMRPEIAKLISPSIYETLHNTESVCTYPSVKGLKKNVFFLHHTHPEVHSQYNEDSWANPHEAQFLVAFARHLILQEYQPSEITILCTYAGQLSELTQQRHNYQLSTDLRITTVDNYQGEENRIILLSLVRNNKEGNIGFLKEENRVCVALSRAREGLYIMGNMNILAKKNQIWPKIKKVLEDADEFGDSIELWCQNHPEESMQVQNAIDFQKSPQGGCLKRCNTKMPCGHICPSVCHASDRKHEDIKCEKPCNETCPRMGHPCPLPCWQMCRSCLVIGDRELECGHTVPIECGADASFPCPNMVDTILPDCNHLVVKPCHKSAADYPCSHPCNMKLQCGHTCQLNCHVKQDAHHLEYKCKQKCTKSNLNCTMDHACNKQCSEECTLCDIKRKKERTCGHFFHCECSENVEEILCHKPCKRQMDCGHTCQLKCNEVCGKCETEVEKAASCGHNIKVKCYQEATPSMCLSKCQRTLACGHACTAKCKDPCITVCKTMTSRTDPGLCGHIFSVPCYLQKSGDPQQLLKYCKEPCRTELPCGHICKGNCGLCLQGRIHMPCNENCNKVLVCGHKCGVACNRECQPCKKVCELKCPHKKCIRKCEEPCAPCKEKCDWGCPHATCSKQCFELCDRKPCNESCPKILDCGHPCIGFCGEPCPQLCRICNRELMHEMFFGDESDARFILLEDCGHCIESKRLFEWISECDESIQIKTCPRCKSSIRKCRRIGNQIRTDAKDSQLIIKMMITDKIQLQNQRELLLEEMKLAARNAVVEFFSDLKNLLDTLLAKVCPPMRKKKKQVLDAQRIKAAKVTFNIVRQILKKLEGIDHTVKISAWLQDQIIMLVQLLSMRGQISNQEIDDIESEIRRLHYMVQVCKMDLETVFVNGDSENSKISFTAVIDKIRSIEKFSRIREQEIKHEIMLLIASTEVELVHMDIDQRIFVKAVGFKQGDWFKCSNAHIYSIDQCDGTKQENKCPECEITSIEE